MKNYNWLPDFVYGGIDGVVTTFAVVAGVRGADLAVTIVLILGFANLFADGFSMAVGKYFSDKAVIQGVSNSSQVQPSKGAFYTFVSFNLVGIIPLLGYIIGPIFDLSLETTFVITVVATLFALFLIGLVKGKIVRMPKIISGLETMFIGGFAALIAYFVGYFIEKMV